MRASVLSAVLAFAVGVSACATPAAPGSGGSEQATNQNDCAVIAAVAKDHYEFNGSDNVPPPLWLFSEEDKSWSPRCDWSRYGLIFPSVYDPDRQPDGRIRWVQFQKPAYDGRGATIEASIMHGPMAGMGVRCRVVSGVAGWTLAGQCENTWVS